MGYLNHKHIRSAISTLTTKGPNIGDTSALVYFFSLKKIAIKYNIKDINLDKTSTFRNEFIKNISSLIKIDELHTWNPIALSSSANWNKGKNIEHIVSSNLLTRQYADKEPNYPRNRPLLDFSNGQASFHNESMRSLDEILRKYDSETINALSIWLIREYNFKKETCDFYEVKNILLEEYGCILPIDESYFSKKLETSEERPTNLSIVLEYVKPINKTKRENQSTGRSTPLTILPKPFLLLAGISGTGKSRFVRQQAQGHGEVANNYCLVAVRPDWHEPSDLLGYSSRLSGKTEYVATDVLRFLVAAWRNLLQAGAELAGDGSRTALTGNSGQLDAAVPFWLCLDEMNLAPVEQYFADYLALIETREWSWDAGDFEYGCDALLNASALAELEPEQQAALAHSLGLDVGDDSSSDGALWQHFLAHGIAIAPNLIVAGTVNMDETTHGFSRKVIDRAMSFDFGEFFPNDFDDFLEGSIQHTQLAFPRHSNGAQVLDAGQAQSSISFLKAVNQVLKGSPFELAYRALNELLLTVHCQGAPEPGAALQAVWDDFLMQKVLPRIEGDADKLQARDEANLLTRLQTVLAEQLDAIWPDGSTRSDFYRHRLGDDGQPVPMAIACRSRSKLQWMLRRLEGSSFTSFWP